jgi:16S rRNA (cytosine967-C5)-methyltransferase
VRLRRAGVHNVTRRPLSSERDPWVKRHKGTFDRVLVDAPCSGSGTWRRNPEARWRFSETDLESLLLLQASILESAARLVRPGGRLTYATCSLLREENEQQADAFLSRSPDFRLIPLSQLWAELLDGSPPVPGPMLRVSPAQHGTDGFFLAAFEREGG